MRHTPWTFRLGLWSLLVALLAAISYAARGTPPQDVLFRYSTAASGIVIDAFILAIVLSLSAGDRRGLLALRAPRPGGWLLAVPTLVAIYAMSFGLDQVLHAGKEQGLTPAGWESGRAAAFAVNVVAIAVVAPIVEELAFRGLGVSLLANIGPAVAVVVVGIAFGLVHGLVRGLPILALFGATLAWLRLRTQSVLPGILVHATYNGISLALAVTQHVAR